jgi:sarcosine oxidase subunit gamma
MTWAPTSAWAGIARPVGHGAGVVATALDNLGLASVHARHGQGKALAAKVKKLTGVVLPNGPQRAENGTIAFVGTGPGAWMAVADQWSLGWAEKLTADLAGLASVVDQSDGYATLRVEGPAVLDVLAKGVFLDLDPSVFPVGSAAGVSVAHIGCVVWRRGELVFEFLTFRSFAQSFWQWLEESAAEYGLTVAQ